jgi:hypothetical protein
MIPPVIGEVLLTDEWNHDARRLVATKFNRDLEKLETDTIYLKQQFKGKLVETNKTLHNTAKSCRKFGIGNGDLQIYAQQLIDTTRARAPIPSTLEIELEGPAQLKTAVQKVEPESVQFILGLVRG